MDCRTLCVLVVFAVSAASACGDTTSSNRTGNTSTTSGAVEADGEPPNDGEGVNYPLVFPVDAKAQAKMDAVTTHNAELDAKCQAMLGDVAPIESDGNGNPVDFGCPRPPENIKLEHWGAN